MDKSKSQKIGNVLFFAAIAIELLIMMTDHSAITLPLRGRFAQLAFIMFGCKILTNSYSKRQWVLIVLVGILGCISYFTCKDEYVLRIAVMLIAAHEIDTECLKKLMLYTVVAGTAIIILLSFTGMLGTSFDVRDYGRGVMEKRWCLGFSHANNVHDMLWYIVSLLVITYHEKLTWKTYTLLTGVNCILLYMTRSRTGWATVQLLIIMCLVFKYAKKIKTSIITYIAFGSSLVFCIAVTVASAMYSAVFDEPRSAILYFLNDKLTQRLEMVNTWAHISTWTWFPEERFLHDVDNGFAKIFYLYGIVIGTVFIAFLIYSLILFYKKRNGILLAVWTTAVFILFMESTYAINTSLLCNLLFIVPIMCWNKYESV